MPNTPAAVQEKREALKSLRSKKDMPQSKLDAQMSKIIEAIPPNMRTQNEKAQLAAARVRDREGAKPKKAPLPSSVQGSGFMGASEKSADIKMDRQMRRGESTPQGYKNGGMVTSRGQGKVSRTRKTRMC